MSDQDSINAEYLPHLWLELVIQTNGGKSEFLPAVVMVEWDFWRQAAVDLSGWRGHLLFSTSEIGSANCCS